MDFCACFLFHLPFFYLASSRLFPRTSYMIVHLKTLLFNSQKHRILLKIIPRKPGLSNSHANSTWKFKIMRTKPIFLSAAVLLSLSACSQGNAIDGPYAGQTAEWFRSHPHEFQQEMDWCNKNSGFPKTGTCLVALTIYDEQHPMPSAGHDVVGVPFKNYGK